MQGLGWRDIIDVVKENKEVTKVRRVVIRSGNRDNCPNRRLCVEILPSTLPPPDLC